MQTITKIMILVIFMLSSVFTGCQTKEEPADSGEVEIKVSYYPSGEVETETEYRNGVRNGMHKLYDEQGNLVSEVKYVNNKLEGYMKTYYPDGTLKASVPYEKGLANGEMITFYPNGKIWRKQVYDMGRLLSTKEFNEEGILQFEDNF